MLQYFCSVSKVHIGKGTWWLPTHESWAKGLKKISKKMLQIHFQHLKKVKHLKKGKQAYKNDISRDNVYDNGLIKTRMKLGS